jgi:hypothetical protein
MLIIFFLGINNIYGQEKIILKKDTIIALEENSIKSLNEIALHRKYLIEELQICDSLCILKDSIIDEKDKQVLRYQRLVKINDTKIGICTDRISELEKEIKKKERTNGLILGSGIFAFFFSILFL